MVTAIPWWSCDLQVVSSPLEGMWGVIWFVFMLSNFYQLDLRNRTLCCINKFMMKHVQNSNRTLPKSPWFGYGYQEYIFIDP